MSPGYGGWSSERRVHGRSWGSDDERGILPARSRTPRRLILALAVDPERVPRKWLDQELRLARLRPNLPSEDAATGPKSGAHRPRHRHAPFALLSARPRSSTWEPSRPRLPELHGESSTVDSACISAAAPRNRCQPSFSTRRRPGHRTKRYVLASHLRRERVHRHSDRTSGDRGAAQAPSSHGSPRQACTKASPRTARHMDGAPRSSYDRVSSVPRMGDSSRGPGSAST
jgi:hypothetical protein